MLPVQIQILTQLQIVFEHLGMLDLALEAKVDPVLQAFVPGILELFFPVGVPFLLELLSVRSGIEFDRELFIQVSPFCFFAQGFVFVVFGHLRRIHGNDAAVVAGSIVGEKIHRLCQLKLLLRCERTLGKDTVVEDRFDFIP